MELADFKLPFKYYSFRIIRRVGESFSKVGVLHAGK
jgi:hypothetical protein